MNATPPTARQIPEFSVVRGDALDRIQRGLRMGPGDGRDGTLRRMIVYTLLAWLPLVGWALFTRRAFEGGAADPLLRHISLHARFLVALPILIYGEKVAQSA